MSSTTIEPRFRTSAVPPVSTPPARSSALLIAAFGAVYLVWGSTYLAMRVGVESFPPFLLAACRHLSAGILLYPLLCWRTGIRPTREHWRTAIVTGCLLMVANGGVCVAEQTVPSGVAALLVATVSFWMVIVDWLWPGGTRPVGRVWAGLALGFGGLVLLVGPNNLGGAGRVDLAGAGILIVASLAWAVGSVYSKHGALPEAALLGVAMQSLAGGTADLIVAWLAGETHAFRFAAITMRSWLALGYLIAFGSMIGFNAYIYILKNSSATRVSTYAFANPVVALFLGWLLIGESITLRTVLAGAIILTAVILVITAPHKACSRRVAAVPEATEA